MAVELEVITRTKSLLGGDILQAAGVLQRLLGRMTRKLEEIRDERQRYQVVKELLQVRFRLTSPLHALSHFVAAVALGCLLRCKSISGEERSRRERITYKPYSGKLS